METGYITLQMGTFILESGWVANLMERVYSFFRTMKYIKASLRTAWKMEKDSTYTKT